MGSNYYIPPEIISIILSLLPGKSLLRFSSICKQWRSIISNPQFINTHLTNSKEQQAYVLIREREADDVVVCINTTDHEVSITLNRFNYFAICSCNGLICLSNLLGDIYVWNPLTRRLKILSSPKMYPLKLNGHLGFGFDSISRDYKVLRITCMCRSSCDMLRYRYFHRVEVELYSCNADSWKVILQVPKALQSCKFHTCSKCVQLKNGLLYLDSERWLLSFDLHNEVFRMYPFPKSVRGQKSNALDFEGSVAMIFESGDSVLSLWTLDDVCGENVSWTEKFHLEAADSKIDWVDSKINWVDSKIDWVDSKIDWVHLILGDGQFVAETFDFGYFFYDYKKKTTKKSFSTYGVKGFTSAVKYTVSLVSL